MCFVELYINNFSLEKLNIIPANSKSRKDIKKAGNKIYPAFYIKLISIK